MKGDESKQSVISKEVQKKVGKMTSFLAQKSGLDILSMDFLVHEI